MLSLLGTGVCVAAEPPAPAASNTRAEQLFRHARAMLAEKNYVDACPLLEQSHRLEPALGTLLNLADCLEHVGKRASAYRAFLLAAEWAQRTGEAKRKEVSLLRAATLEPSLSRLRIVLNTVPAGANADVINADGAVVERWSLEDATVDQPLDPGQYTVSVTAPKYVAVKQRVEVGATPGLVTVVLSALELDEHTAQVAVVPMPVPVAREVRPLSPSAPHSPRLKTAGIATLIAGAVVGGTSIGGLIWSGDVLARVDRQQPGGPDATTPTVTRNEYATAQPVNAASIVGAIVGGVAVITGAVLIIVGNSSSLPGSVAFNVNVSPHGAGVSFGGQF